MRAILLAPLLLAGCSLFSSDGYDGPQACTEEFRFFTVDIRLASGEPVEDARVTATNRRTGTTYGPCSDEAQREGVGCPMPGVEGAAYTIYSDALASATSRDGDDVTVRAAAGARTAEANFRFRFDGCHVVQLDGPDTILLP